MNVSQDKLNFWTFGHVAALEDLSISRTLSSGVLRQVDGFIFCKNDFDLNKSLNISDVTRKLTTKRAKKK
jgi:hypothetical protein